MKRLGLLVAAILMSATASFAGNKKKLRLQQQLISCAAI